MVCRNVWGGLREGKQPCQSGTSKLHGADFNTVNYAVNGIL